MREAQARVDQGCAIKVKRCRAGQKDFGGMGRWFTLPLPVGLKTTEEPLATWGPQSRGQNANGAPESVAMWQDSRLAIIQSQPSRLSWPIVYLRQWPERSCQWAPEPPAALQKGRKSTSRHRSMSILFQLWVREVEEHKSSHIYKGITGKVVLIGIYFLKS